MLKPFINKLNICILIVSISIPLSAFGASLSDVSSNKNEPAIQYLYSHGIISGYPDGTFKPDNTVNRAELLKILVGGKGITPAADQNNNCFPDVKAEWFAPFVCYAKTQGWVDGYPDGTFKPSQEVNKVEALKMLVNSQGYEVQQAISEQLFDDVNNTQWYAPFIKAAKDKGLLEIESGSYGIAQQMKRGEISENIYRAIIMKEFSLNKFVKNFQIDGIPFYQVVRVVDGDTLDVHINGETKRIRLIGLDTPETVDPNKPVQCYGPEASAKAKEMLFGNFVSMEADETQGDADKYSRLLRYIILKDSTNFEKWLIENGYGYEYTYNTPYKYQADFMAAEATASTNKVGLWAENTCNGQTTTVNNPTNTGAHLFYVSSQAKSKYYCDTDPAWHNLSPSNLLTYSTEEELKQDYPNLILNEPCK